MKVAFDRTGKEIICILVVLEISLLFINSLFVCVFSYLLISILS